MELPTPVEQMSYESAYAEIEEIIAALESNQRPLEEAMSLFERGQCLITHCISMLDKTELKIRQLLGDSLMDLSEEG